MSFLVIFIALFCRASPSLAVDVFDPNGNITIVWDVLRWTEPDATGYEASVRIYNQQLYRHIDAPGWTLSWTWSGREVIWKVRGAQAKDQDDCSRIKKDVNILPHSCALRPVMRDLKPDATEDKKTANCCRGGVLSSLTQDPGKAVAAFRMEIGDSRQDAPDIPVNFTFGKPGPGYVCGAAQRVEPSILPDGDWNGRAFATWNVTCVYERYQAERAQTCCVSFSSFYNPRITPCTKCACGCSGSREDVLRLQHASGEQPVCKIPENTTNVLQRPGVPDKSSKLYCLDDMCPIRVHWHVKRNYKGFWRAKVSIANRHLKNYTEWNLAVEHPNLHILKEAFSFNSKHLAGDTKATLFWGISHYNDMLLQAGDNGMVQSEMIFNKDETFTLKRGWAFPHRVLFNGDECSLPPPDSYPSLPNSARRALTNMSILPLIFFTFFLLTNGFVYG